MNIISMYPLYTKKDNDNPFSLEARANLAKTYGIQTPLNISSGIPNTPNTFGMNNMVQPKNPSQSILDYFGDKIDGLLQTNYMEQPVSNVTTYDVDGTTATQVNRIPDVPNKPKVDVSNVKTPTDNVVETGGLLDNLNMSDIQGLLTLFSGLTSTNSTPVAPLKGIQGTPTNYISPYTSLYDDEERRV
tara:strand:- start:15012 stop:15575 length:564 start_codon:yes stop_codon:yes gene_type:complete